MNKIFPWIIMIMIAGPVALGAWQASMFLTHRETVEEPPVVLIPGPEEVIKVQTYMQFSSSATTDEARTNLQKASSIIDELGLPLDSLNLQIYKVKLVNGTWYRVVIPVTSVAVGNDLCAKVKDSGKECIVLSF